MAFIKLVCLTILLSCLAVYSDAEGIYVPLDDLLITQEQFEKYVSNNSFRALYCFGDGFDFEGIGGLPLSSPAPGFSLKCDGKFRMNVQQTSSLGGYRISWVNRVDDVCDNAANKDFTLGVSSLLSFVQEKAKGILTLNKFPGSPTLGIRFVSRLPESQLFMLITPSENDILNGVSQKGVVFFLVPGTKQEIDTSCIDWQIASSDLGLGFLARFGKRNFNGHAIKDSWLGEDCPLPTFDSSIPIQRNFPDFPPGFPTGPGFPNLPPNQNPVVNPPQGGPPSFPGGLLANFFGGKRK